MKLTEVLENANELSSYGTDDEDRVNNKDAINLYKSAYQEANGEINDPEIFNSWGMAHFGLGEFEEAIEKYSLAIELDPNSAAMYSYRGLACNKSGRYEEAITDLNRAIELYGDAIDYYNRGVAKNGVGQHEEAIQDFDMAIELNPDMVLAYYRRGLLRSETDQHEGTVYDLDTAWKLHQDTRWEFTRLRYNKEGNLNDHEKNIKAHLNYLDSEMDYGLAFQTKGDSQMELGKYQEAFEAFRVKAHLMGQYPHEQTWAAIIDDQQDKNSEAVSGYQSVLLQLKNIPTEELNKNDLLYLIGASWGLTNLDAINRTDDVVRYKAIADERGIELGGK
jgi:tetratricopeptide (TPR) repeat protein